MILRLTSYSIWVDRFCCWFLPLLQEVCAINMDTLKYSCNLDFALLKSFQICLCSLNNHFISVQLFGIADFIMHASAYNNIILIYKLYITVLIYKLFSCFCFYRVNSHVNLSLHHFLAGKEGNMYRYLNMTH